MIIGLLLRWRFSYGLFSLSCSCHLSYLQRVAEVFVLGCWLYGIVIFSETKITKVFSWIRKLYRWNIFFLFLRYEFDWKRRNLRYEKIRHIVVTYRGNGSCDFWNFVTPFTLHDKILQKLKIHIIFTSSCQKIERV